MALYTNRWEGFSLERPEGYFKVVLFKGMVLPRLDPVGCASALLWPVKVPPGSPADALARHFASLARASEPSFVAFRSPRPEGDGILLRTKAKYLGRPVEGTYRVAVNGGSGIVAGYQAPAEAFTSLAPTFGKLLASWRQAPSLRRVPFRDPTEGAFSAQIPEGFMARGGIQRQAGAALAFDCADRSNTLRASVPPASFFFTEPLATAMGILGGLFGGMGMGMGMGMPGGPPPMKYMTAPDFATQFLLPKAPHRGTRVESVEERPDLVPFVAAEYAQQGFAAGSVQPSVATANFLWEEGGRAFRDRLEVSTVRVPMMGTWCAALSSTITAPLDQWDEWEPVLTGIVSSVQINPAWQQAENARNNATMAAQQADIHRRQREISRTLSETSDIIAQGYWERQSVYDRISHDRSNAMLGRQDMIDPSGHVFNVPTGFDQYWRDNMNNVMGGSWLAQPDPTWHRLDPTR